MKEITLKQIAETLGISITTVSKALKNYPDVSPKTKKMVLELAEQLHYTPNSFAVNLRTKESKTIGLIIPEVVHHFFSNVVNGIIAEAEKTATLTKGDDGFDTVEYSDDEGSAEAMKAAGSDETAKELSSTPEEKKVKFNQFLASVKKNKDDKAKIDGILKLTRSDFEGPVNIGSEEMVTINQLAQMAINSSGKSITIKNIVNKLNLLSS